MLTVKPKMISQDDAEHLFKCGQVWRKYLNEEPVIVVTEHTVSPTDLFKQYYDVIKLGIDKGLVKLLTLDKVEAHHLEMTIVEF